MTNRLWHLPDTWGEVRRLKAEVERLRALLEAFESLPVRRMTHGTVVMERGPLDDWRAKAGER